MPVILVENGSYKGKRFSLKPPGPFAIGRDQTTEICIPDPMVSRRHCVIEIKKNAYTIRDLGSANGTVINNKKVERKRLRKGDRILAGETLLTFLGDDSGDPLIGKKLRGYEIVERIGRGGMGTVYKARQISLDRMVALKVLSPEMVEDPTFVSKFLDEAQAAARLSHPNIVMVYDIDDEVVDGRRLVYYSMEFMAGGSVEDLLNRKGPRPAEEALRIALETAQGLQFAEQVGIVHRDIKPGNLMIHETGMVKIGDLGIAARNTGEGTMASQRGGICGSPHYISPEQIQGEDLDSRADIYSLGASLHQMLVGRPPFFSTDLRELLMKQVKEPPPDLAKLLPEIPPGVPPLVAKMLEKNRDRRYLNPRQLITGINEVLEEINAPSQPASPGDSRGIRNVLIAGIVVVIFLGLVAGGTMALARYLRYRSEHQRKELIYKVVLEEAGASLVRDDLEKAQEQIEKLDDPLLEVEFPEIGKELASLRAKISRRRAKRALERRNAEAAEALSSLRGKMPDLAGVLDGRELEALIPPLSEFREKYAGTPAAQEAGAEVIRVEKAVRDLKIRLRRSEDALRLLLITAQTFLESDPPRFREALEKLRAPPAEIRGTPQEKELQKQIEEITAQMIVAAARWSEEARKAAGQGRADEAIRDLQWRKDRVEGLALSAIEETIKKIRSEQKKDSGEER